MKVVTSYSVKIKNYNKIFGETVRLYRKAVDFFIDVCLAEWDSVSTLEGNKLRQRYIETQSHQAKSCTAPRYHFDQAFYKFPAYLRRAAISHALGSVSSYKSHLSTYNKKSSGNPPRVPKAGHVYPAMFRDNCFVRTGTYTARIKVYVRNTWDWLAVELKKTDVDYILRHCQDRKECVPTLRKRGKEWFLDFAFEKNVRLTEKPVHERTIVSVDLGLNNACTCCVMTSEGTILDRKFLSLKVNIG